MKPCPFCGGNDIRWSAEKFQGHRFSCRTCHALGPWSEPDRGATARETSDIRTKAAAELWNTRPLEADMEVALDAYAHGPPAESQQLNGALAAAEAANARAKALEAAAKPFVDFASLSSFDKLPDNTPMTKGSSIAARQITAGDFKLLRRAALEAKPSSILPTAAPWEGGKP